MGKRTKPHDPAAAARVAYERVQREQEIARLEALGATVTLDASRKVVSARLSNVFNVLLARKAITANQFDAAYTLRCDWAMWKGLDGGAELSGEFVDGGSGCREIVTDRMREGQRRVAKVLDRLYPHTRKVIEAFMVATVEEDRPMSWRGIMEGLGVKPGQITINGQRKDRQTLAFVRAIEAVRVIYQEPRRAAA